MVKIFLKKAREKSVLRKHPWIFSGAIQLVQGHPQPGETVMVLDVSGEFLGYGAYSPQSQIAVRLWSFTKSEEISSSFFQERLQRAIRWRYKLGVDRQTTAFRIVASEADELPGLIVDQYNDFLVCQFLSAGSEFWKKTIVQQLIELLNPKGIYERSDVPVRKKEGLPLRKGILYGKEPPELLEINEHGLHFLVDLKKGHKTGFYLDQRLNRQLVRQHSAGKQVLNCFAYTGGFALAALQGGAEHVTSVEDVAALMDLQEKNMQINHFQASQYVNIKGDVFKVLRQYDIDGRKFDLIVLDPPKFVDAFKNLIRGSRGYKDINRLAFKLLRAGGLLFTFSCSGLMTMELFQKIVANAALEAGKNVQILKWLAQGPDHPIKLHIPESLYLKGLLCQVKNE